QIATLRTTTEDIVLRRTKRGKVELARLKASSTTPPEQEHDKVKEKRAEGGDGYIFHLGITDKNGKVIQRMADKFRQINKYLEIMEGLISAANLSGSLRVVDMGAGKGYLTFALYDFLVNKLNLDVSMTGVEMRQGLVDDGNKLAQKCRFEKLKFESSEIADFDASGFNIVIALHACDTATDDALAKGIGAGAELIVCAPCCHKQIRQQLKGKEHNNPLLKYGIFKEREFEMVTDTLRALILERNGYKSNIFEFISNEHTRKNTMLVGTRSNHKADTEPIDQKISALKQDYQIEYHYLEKLV
ncbi:MAG: SAM-dependent methyltransferase, partial [Cyclobacteriaceae bacterium]